MTVEAPEVIQSKRTLRRAIIRIVLLALITGGFFILASETLLNYSIENIKAQQRNRLVQYVTMAYNNITPILDRLKYDEISQDEALLEIRNTVRRMTYTDEYGPNYIFMSSYDGIMLVQPYEPQKEMTNMWGLQDINGVYIIRELVYSAQEYPGGGFVSYYYYPPNSSEPEEKLSYVMGVPEINAYIGTGTYMGKFYTQQRKIVTLMGLLLLGSLMFIGGSVIGSIYQIRGDNKQLVLEIAERRKAQAAIELSEKNLKIVFDSTYDAIIIHDDRGNILDINQRMLKMYNVEYEQALKYKIENLSASADIQKASFDDVVNRAFRGEEILLEWKALRPNNKEQFDVEVGLRAINWYGKQAILAVIRDISERKAAERERRHYQYALEHSQEMAHVGHYWIEIETGIRTWSKELYRIFARDLTRPTPKSDELRTIFLEGDWDRIQTIQTQSLKTGRPTTTNIGIRRPDGSIRYLSVLVDIARNEDGKPTHYIGTVQDITERKEYEDTLRNNEEKFSSVVEQMAEGLHLVDERGIIITWNKAQEEITGISRESALGRPLWEVQMEMLPFDQRSFKTLETLEEMIRKALTDNSSQYFTTNGKINIIQSGSTQKTVLQTSFPVTTRSGHHIGALLHNISDLIKSQAHVEHELQKLNALREIDAGIVNQANLTEILETVASQAQKVLKANGVHFILLDPANQQLKVAATFGFKGNVSTYSHLYKVTCLPWVAIKQGGLVCATEGEYCLRCEEFNREGFKAIYAIPIYANRQVKGVIELFTYEPLEIDKEWEDFFSMLGGQTAIALEKAGLFHDLQVINNELYQAYEATIVGWSRALELRDKETKGHSDRVMNLATELAMRLDYPEDKIQHFRRGVLLHDIGKMGIPDSILLKPGPLTDDEWMIMRMHPDFAYHLLEGVPYLHEALEIPYCHHERWNGSGYPRGLKGEDIPLSARIFAVVDIWDALVSDRPYRPGWTEDATRNYLQQQSGILVDERVVKEFLKMIS